MRIGVLMGGISTERDVSLETGKAIVNNINKKKYEVVPIIIDKKEDVLAKCNNIDFAFLALHGKFGEDGSVQKILEVLNIPYSGCNALSSSICMDKDIAKKIMVSQNIKTPKWISIKSVNDIDYDYIKKMKYPIFIKPNSGGSSVATFLIEKEENVKKAVETVLLYDKIAIIEEYIKGDEITCPILNGKVLPILAIKPKGKFFDLKSKYTDSEAYEYVVNFNENMQKKIETIALNAYDSLRCSVYARVDMIIKDGESYVLEVNTLPGMTKNSLFPKSCNSINIDFSTLLDLIIEYSLKEKR
ncbi:D-alanine--D-alanine ligase [Sarcina ventriculi]|uniref:D-alanine--D-alanine ligase n=1 Tax=Sarcina ventriculi TaxID=1267 RepID=UPI000D8D2B22|nr:D-alanine--D-alanine ligase [Sarcina ventriculi]SPZ49120.1 D-alanine--D-alanine ligase [Sarcina ventriculi]